jgi:hypothetical protein
MRGTFYEGQQLSYIEFPDGRYFEVGNNADSIEIIMEPGQENYVPWALIKLEDCADVKANLANVAYVNIEDEDEDEEPIGRPTSRAPQYKNES